jgi:lipopolysaccharide heptosyltransferase I
VKVLILKPSSLGDVVQAFPVLRLIKAHLPSAEVHWWIDSALAPLLEGDPHLAGVIRFERRRWGKPVHWDELLASIRTLRRHRFDWVIDLQSLARSGAFAWLSGGRLIVGLDDPREGARGFYDIVVRRPGYLSHAVDWYLGVLPHLGVPVHRQFDWIPERPEISTRVRSQAPNDACRWICLQPGARWENKRWPAERFAELAGRLSETRSEVRFAIIGGRDEQELGARIASAAPGRCLDLTGRTSLVEMVEWVRRCDLLVTNDTGPMHVAAAIGKPVVALFGPTEAARTGPYGQLKCVLRHPLPCAPCMDSRCGFEHPMECLRGIGVERVLRAVSERLFAAPIASAP